MRTPTGTRIYHVMDERGSVIAAQPDSGTIWTVENTYDAYGRQGGDEWGRFGYTGQMRSFDLELLYYKARWYNPELGRFMQTDPIGYGDGMNMYGYVGGDPVNFTDPSGTEDVIVVVGGRRQSPDWHTTQFLLQYLQTAYGGGTGGSAGGGGSGWGGETSETEVCGSANISSSSASSFVDGLVGGFTAPITSGIHQNNLQAGNDAAIAVDNAFGLALAVINNNRTESFQIAQQHLLSNPGQAAGRAIGSTAFGTIAGGGLGGRVANGASRLLGGVFARHPNIVRGVGAASGAATNFTLSQQGAALQELYRLQSQANAAGIPFDALSIEVISDAAIAGAAGLNVDFDSETGEITICPGN